MRNDFLDLDKNARGLSRAAGAFIGAFIGYRLAIDASRATARFYGDFITFGYAVEGILLGLFIGLAAGQLLYFVGRMIFRFVTARRNR